MLTIHNSIASKKTGVVLAMVASLFSFACGGDDSSPDTGGKAGASAGGSSGSGTGGSGGKVEGSSGAGGSATGGVSAGGSGGAGSLMPFACAPVQPAGDVITDFAMLNEKNEWGDAAKGVWGGIFDYGPDVTGGVTHTVEDGALHVSGTVTGYSGAGLWFGPCTDASKYDGIQFTVTGDAGMMDMTFQVQTNANYPIATDPMTQGSKGACPHDAADPADDFSVCASAQKVFMAPGTVMVPWSDLTGGKPNMAANPAEIIGLQWQFFWEGASVTDPADPKAFMVDVTIDDVKFYTAP